jgi:endo-1,4-beta-xylanase
MNNCYHLIKKLIISFLTISLLVVVNSPDTNAQDKKLNESIAKFRKGQLVVQAKQGSNVNVEQIRHEFWFGCAIPNSLAGGMSPDNLKQFKLKFLENFNAAVPENSFKWITMEPRRGEVNWAVTDSILSWTEKNHIPLRGHNVFWGKTKYIQPWLIAMNDDELKQTLQNRAESVAKRYKGRFAEYDLNNEMLDENYYQDRLGSEITKQMAQWVHNGDPDAKIFLNEHDILIPESPAGNRLAPCMALIRSLLKQGVPIAGIGIQGHSHLVTFDRQALKRGLDSLAIFKIPIRITEFNMPGRGYPIGAPQTVLTPEQEVTKAKDIVDFYRICFAHPAVEGILMWGFWEGSNWIPASSLYKRDWSPYPAAESYHNLIYKEWWTKESGVAGKDGVFKTQAFFGKYKVTVDGVTKEIDLTKTKGKATVDFRN